MEEEKAPQIKNKIEDSFYENFVKLLKNQNFETNSNLFKVLYKYSKNKNTKNKISIKLLQEKNKWIPLFNKIKENITFINKLYTDYPIQNTTFNKFTNLYNDILKLIESYFKIIESIKENKYIYINFLIIFDEDNKFNIENIYSLIEETNRSINTKNILSKYHDSMISKQKSKKNKTTTKNETPTKNESKYDYALNKSNKYLVKFRRVSLKSFIKGSDKLEISELFYNLRKVVQILVLLKPTIKYYYNSRNYIVNEDLRSNLLTLIKVLQGSVSRSNKLTDPNKETERTKIRNEFKRRMLDNLNNNYNFINKYKNENNKQLGRNFRSKIKENLELNN